MKKINGFQRGMGIGGWLTNYKRFNVLPNEWRMPITVGDMEHFETYISEKDIKNISGMGFDHVRVGFDQIVLESAPYVYRDEIIALLKNFVSWCKKYSLTPVLNLHKAIGNYCDIAEDVTLLENAELQDRFIAMWLKLEEVFEDEQSVMFELLNEVRNVDPALWNDLAEKTLKALREKNKTRWIIIGSTCWNSPAKLEDLRVYDDENVIYTYHNYEPFEFTHQRGVLQSAPLYYNRKMEYPSEDIERYRDYKRMVAGEIEPYSEYEKIDIDFLRDRMKGAAEFVKKHPEKILWLGEFGTIRHADIKSRENYMRDVISIAKESDIPYCVWNYLSTPNDGNRFSLVDDDTRKILSEGLLKALLGE